MQLDNGLGNSVLPCSGDATVRMLFRGRKTEEGKWGEDIIVIGGDHSDRRSCLYVCDEKEPPPTVERKANSRLLRTYFAEEKVTMLRFFSQEILLSSSTFERSTTMHVQRAYHLHIHLLLYSIPDALSAKKPSKNIQTAKELEIQVSSPNLSPVKKKPICSHNLMISGNLGRLFGGHHEERRGFRHQGQGHLGMGRRGENIFFANDTLMLS